MAGYSGTPLAKKLGIKTGCRLYLADAPDDYLALLEPLPDGLAMVARPSSTTDIAHLFVTSRATLASRLQQCLAAMRDDATIWVSWPKKSAKVPSDVTEDTIRAVALPMGLVDVKVCAVDATWSGLKLVVRRENRKPKG
ncbi:MAG TPA: DUF3052 domain-containing protein [Xanthomonadaceae bacterium]|jgi:hypothetical protein